MVKVLHICPHVGGGVGVVLRELLSASHDADVSRHTIACLDSIQKDDFNAFQNMGIPISDDCFKKGFDNLFEMIHSFDIIQIHFWNNPQLYALLAYESWPECRTVIWSHVNGHSAPQAITESALHFPDVFILASEYSFSAPWVLKQPDSWKQNNLKCIHSNSGVHRTECTKIKKHSEFTIAYIGTVDSCKMHTDYLPMHANLAIDDYTVLVCGNDIDSETQNRANHLGIENNFDFKGYVHDVSEILAVSDVFGYPLNKNNFGTGEQVLIEAMAAGVPPVVFNNGCESVLVKDNETGIVVNSVEEYREALLQLYTNPSLRKSLGNAARAYAINTFSINETISQWNVVYDSMMLYPARIPVVVKPSQKYAKYGPEAALFLNALGDDEIADDYLEFEKGNDKSDVLNRLDTLDPIFYHSSRGSVFQYSTTFNSNSWLRSCSALLKQRYASNKVVV